MLAQLPSQSLSFHFIDHSPRRKGWDGIGSLMVPLVDRRVVVAEHGFPQLWGYEVKRVETDAGGDGPLDKVHADALVPPAEKALAAQHLQKRARDRSVPEMATLTNSKFQYVYSIDRV